MRWQNAPWTSSERNEHALCADGNGGEQDLLGSPSSITPHSILVPGLFHICAREIRMYSRLITRIMIAFPL